MSFSPLVTYIEVLFLEWNIQFSGVSHYLFLDTLGIAQLFIEEVLRMGSEGVVLDNKACRMICPQRRSPQGAPRNKNKLHKPSVVDPALSFYEFPYSSETDPGLVAVPRPVNNDGLSLSLLKSATNPQNLLS